MSLKRISNWKTTSLGAVLIVASVVSVFTQDVSWVDASVPITIGLGLLMSKDDWINRTIKFAIIGLFISCNPVKKVLSDKDKFDFVAKEVIRRGYCKADTVKVTITKDSIVYKDKIVFEKVPCQDIDTTIGRYKVKISSGVLTISGRDSIVYRTNTITNNIRDIAREQVLESDLSNRDSLIFAARKEIELVKLDAKSISVDANKWKLRFFMVISILAILTVLFIKKF